MKISRTVLVVLALGAFGAMLAPLASASETEFNFAVLAGSTVTNVVGSATIINGEMGVYSGTACTGFVAGTGCTLGAGELSVVPAHLGDAVAQTAQADLTTDFNTENGLTPTATFASGVLPSSLGPGVYSVAAAVSNLTGTLTLTDGGVAHSVFVFQFSSALNTASGSKVDVSGLSPTDSLFWVVDSTATLGDDTVFEGNILALTNYQLRSRCNGCLRQSPGAKYCGEFCRTGQHYYRLRMKSPSAAWALRKRVAAPLTASAARLGLVVG